MESFGKRIWGDFIWTLLGAGGGAWLLIAAGFYLSRWLQI